MKQIVDLVRGNLLLLLFICLILLQFLTWRGTVAMRAELDTLTNSVRYYACGHRPDSPCYVASQR